jgi:hypothetical protein
LGWRSRVPDWVTTTIAFGAKRGCVEASLTVAKTNAPAIALYGARVIPSTRAALSSIEPCFDAQ